LRTERVPARVQALDGPEPICISVGVSCQLVIPDPGICNAQNRAEWPMTSWQLRARAPLTTAASAPHMHASKPAGAPLRITSIPTGPVITRAVPDAIVADLPARLSRHWLRIGRGQRLGHPDADTVGRGSACLSTGTDLIRQTLVVAERRTVRCGRTRLD